MSDVLERKIGSLLNTVDLLKRSLDAEREKVRVLRERGDEVIETRLEYIKKHLIETVEEFWEDSI